MSTQRLLISLLFAIISSLLVLNAPAAQDIHQYIKSVKQRYSQGKAVPPTLKKTKTIQYTGADKRSPFERPVDSKSSTQYPKAVLKDYPIKSLTLTGILQYHKKKWAIIKTPDAKIYRITLGDRVGNNFGLVKKITDNQVIFEEDLSVGLEMKKKTVTLNMKGIQ